MPVGGKVVNYYYRAVVNTTEQMKDFKKIVIWKNETRYDVQHVFDRELETDITGFENNSIFLSSEYGTKTQIARRMYDGAIGFSPGGTYYPSVKKINEAEEKFVKMMGYESKASYNASKQGQEHPLDLVAQPNGLEVYNDYTTIQSSLLSENYTLSVDQADFRTRGVNGDLDVLEGTATDNLNTYESKLPQGAELELTKVTYNIDGGEEKVLSEDGFTFSRAKGTMQEGKTTHFTYHYKLKKREEVTNTENLTGSVVVKYVNTDGVEIKDSVTVQDNMPAGQRLTKEIMSGTANIGTKTEDVAGTTEYNTTSAKEDRIEKDGKTYVLTRVLPEDTRFGNVTEEEGIVKPGTTTVVYEYRELEKGGVVANYYIEGTETKLADSETQSPSYYGTTYSTVSKEIEPKVVVEDTPEKTVTRTTTYELVETPSNATGEINSELTVVNYYYREVVKEDVALKYAPVVANYYLEGTAEKLADSDNQGDKQIGSTYSTVSKEITPKTEVQDLVDRVITTVTTYELVATPTDAEGIVPSEGKVVNYYYRPTVSKTTVMKKAHLTVNYLLEGTREALHPQDVQEELVIHSDYATTPVEIAPKVERKVERNKEVITTTRYELVATPNNAKGTISVGGTVVDYFYRAVVTVDEYPTIPNEAPKTDFPEYTDLVGTPGIPEVHDKLTYLGLVGKPGDPEVHELPEFNGGVIPNEAPKVEMTMELYQTMLQFMNYQITKHRLVLYQTKLQNLNSQSSKVGLYRTMLQFWKNLSTRFLQYLKSQNNQ